MIFGNYLHSSVASQHFFVTNRIWEHKDSAHLFVVFWAALISPKWGMPEITCPSHLAQVQSSHVNTYASNGEFFFDTSIWSYPTGIPRGQPLIRLKWFLPLWCMAMSVMWSIAFGQSQLFEATDSKSGKMDKAKPKSWHCCGSKEMRRGVGGNASHSDCWQSISPKKASVCVGWVNMEWKFAGISSQWIKWGLQIKMCLLWGFILRKSTFSS